MTDKSSTIEILARGVAISDGRVLLCRNIAKNYHYLPGGHVEFGEPAATALQREMIEEAALKVEVQNLLLVSEHHFIQSGTPRHELNVVFGMVFHVEHVESRESDIAFDWVDLAVVQDLDVRPLAIRAWLASGGANESGAWLSDFGSPKVSG